MAGEPQHSSTAGWRPSRRTFVALVLVGALLGVWRTGTFDRALVHVGLNAEECAQNGFGATFCGDELRRYRRSIEGPRQHTPEPPPLTDEEIRSARYNCRIGLQSGCDLLESYGVPRTAP